MIQLEKGCGGAGNKLKVGLDDLYAYGINLLDVQMMLIICGVPRLNRASEARMWVMYI